MTHGELVRPRELEPGDRVALYWSPYGWARDLGHSSPVEGRVVEANDNDVVVESGGRRYRHYVGRGYILGDATAKPDVPDRTDVGRFGKYERLGSSSSSIGDDLDKLF